MVPTVVILGGAYGGLQIAHSLLKNNKEAKVILVSKNSHFYWNLASVRAIVPGSVEDKQLFLSLADALSRYSKERYEIVIGSAESVDTNTKTVKVAIPGTAEQRAISYDQLVLATGSRNTQPERRADAAADEAVPATPWKADGTYEDITALLDTTREKVKAAKRIVIAGGGATGVEVAAELGHAFGGKPADKGGKEIILLSAGAEILSGDAIAGSALNKLKKLHVDVRTGAGVSAAHTLPDGRVGLTVAGASEPLVADLYLAAVGLTPNTEYLDASLLTDRKTVDVDEFYHVKGVASKDVWAVGDIVSKPRAGFVITMKQAEGVAKNVDVVLKGKAPQAVKLLPVDVLVVAAGPNRGTGRVGSLRLPSLAVRYIKARTLGLQMLSGFRDGSAA
ncbi:hypothetical protein SPBR_08987 [Sporothrix brasiliensis 5110]|uniref:FAD/NAD(P)-binding domain-containing protein n=1 Tax=Sporothrix brasiliensis 5110 TaxID=1398154 RepID=A0A0C2IJR4_9PEZI|nr:uncharacterized protein SPBR_08987 [Sporothrix brasiliensis 5110]KIH89411.1 hypothetical protein SPBR_08987 [Sporothrix brasiliensis 5110]